MLLSSFLSFDFDLNTSEIVVFSPVQFLLGLIDKVLLVNFKLALLVVAEDVDVKVLVRVELRHKINFRLKLDAARTSHLLLSLWRLFKLFLGLCLDQANAQSANTRAADTDQDEHHENDDKTGLGCSLLENGHFLVDRDSLRLSSLSGDCGRCWDRLYSRFNNWSGLGRILGLVDVGCGVVGRILNLNITISGCTQDRGTKHFLALVFNDGVQLGFEFAQLSCWV